LSAVYEVLWLVNWGRRWLADVNVNKDWPTTRHLEDLQLW